MAKKMALDFTQHLSDSLPETWGRDRLDELADFANGLWKGKREPFVAVNVLRNTNFNNDGTLDLSDVAQLDVQVSQFGQRQLQAGDILLERSGGGPTQPVGRVVYFGLEADDFSFSNFTTRIRVRDASLLHPKYLLYHLLEFYLAGHTNSLQARTTGIRNLMFADYQAVVIPLPPLPEQRRIATVLSAIQDAIAAQEDVIAAARALKRSLMQRLFTYGPGREPAETQETEIGEIPVGWEVVELGDAVTLQRGFDLPKRDRIPGGYPVVTSSGITDRHFEAKVSGPGVVTGRYGTLGAVFYIEDDFWPHNTTLWVKDFHNNHRKFTAYFLQSLNFQSFNDKTSVPGINRNDLHLLKVGIPTYEEQVSIAQIIDNTDAKIAAEEDRKAALEALFKSTLHQLMSGQIRLLSDEGLLNL